MILNHAGAKSTELQKCPGPFRSNFTFSPPASYDMTCNLQQLASAHFYKLWSTIYFRELGIYWLVDLYSSARTLECPINPRVEPLQPR